ncbi:MAG: hypothetical protein AAB638_00945 [Patescibacteria group bacterium]
MNRAIRTILSILTILTAGIIPAYSTFASQSFANPQVPASATLDPQTIVCRGLGMTGMSCATTGIAVGDYQPKPIRLNFDILGSSTSNTNTSSDLTATISNAKAPKSLTGEKINIVSVPSSPDIYQLVNGHKHPFPSMAVFYDYGYTTSMIQPITQQQLDKYPRANLVKVKGDSKRVYYLTEGGMLRPVVNTKKIFEFYGDRTEDIITISRKEFNFYPISEYVYQESPLNRDVFQISGNGKRYLSPMAVYRLGIRAEQVAPVRKAELDYYKTLKPLID